MHEWRGLPAMALQLPGGDSALIALQGAQLLSWVSGGRERLFVSPRAAHDGHTPIRGGIPVCFPQFNQRGPLVKHGFARCMAWSGKPEDAQPVEGGGLQITLRFEDSEATRAVWPHAFEALLTVELLPGALSVRLAVHNRGAEDLPFTAALHSYLQVPGAEQIELLGLDGLSYWDAAAAGAAADTHPVQAGAVRFGVETDRVYPRAAQALRLQTLSSQPLLQIAQDAAWSETVVWNPGPALCARLSDMAPDSWQHMLCVEAAAIDAPVVIAPGGHWQAAQHLRAL